MAVLATPVYVGGVRYEAGTTPPDAIADKIRLGAAWVGGVAPALTGAGAGGAKEILTTTDLRSSTKLRAALGLGSAALLDAEDIDGVSPGDVTAAVNTAVPPAVAAAVAAAGVASSGDVGTFALATTTLGNGEVFYSRWLAAPGGFPADGFASVRLEATADAAYTAVLQGSVNGVDTPYELHQHTVTTANGVSTVAQTVTSPPARHVRWAITATAAGMTKFSAKGITA